MDLIDAAIADLARSRTVPQELEAPATSGVYALYLRTATDIAGFPAGKNGLIYIGKGLNLQARDLKTHFGTGKTGNSTVRRTLGALMKSELSLTAIPRSATAKPTQYKFESDGEERLTAWMMEELEIGVHVVEGDFRAVEKALIARLEPVLNLTDWENPYRKRIKAMRSFCAREAAD